VQGVATFSSVPVILIVGVMARFLGWRSPFGLFALFAIPAFILAFFSVEKRPGVFGKADQGAGALAGGMSAIRLWPIFLLVFSSSLLNTMGVAQLPFLLKGEGVTAPPLLAVILSLCAMATGIGAVFSASIQTRIGEKTALIAAVVIAGVGDVIAGAIGNAWFAAAGSIFSYLGLGILLAMSYTLVLNRATPEERGVAVGYLHAVMFIGQFANPVLLAPLNAAIGLRNSYVVAGVIAMVAAFAGGAFSRRLSKVTQ
jgi:MFS family permease